MAIGQGIISKHQYIERVFGYRVVISSAKAIATFLAGVMSVLLHTKSYCG